MAGSLFVPPALAYPPPGVTERVSVASDGAEANGGQTYTPDLSADGRYVAFQGEASNLVPGDTNASRDVFVRDRATGVTERVSVASDGAEGNRNSYYPAISADGRYVAFTSDATNLVAGDTNNVRDAFVRDRAAGTTERISVATDGGQANQLSPDLVISGDGRYVAFGSDASNLVPGDTNAVRDIFVRDRASRTTERVSVAWDGSQSTGVAYDPAISADGRYVAFQGGAPNLVPGDTNAVRDIFVRDRAAGVTERVSVASDGSEANDFSQFSDLSGDGRYVVFGSPASNLVPWDVNGMFDVFLRDRLTGSTERVSVTSEGVEASGQSVEPIISDDGRWVAFQSSATNLAPGDSNDNRDVFAWDRVSGTTERVSVASDGSEATPPFGVAIVASTISANGRYVAFDSSASNLVPEDSNDLRDVFVRDTGPAVGVGGLTVESSGDRVVAKGWASFSGTIVASAADPPDDGARGAREAGGELTGASIAFRPEAGDLLLRLDLDRLPRVPREQDLCFLTCAPETGTAGAPGVVYGLQVAVGSVRYEVRASRLGATADPPEGPAFDLYRCEDECTQQQRLSGGIGTFGEEVRIAVPLSAIGAAEGTSLTLLRVFTGTGEVATGMLQVLDDVALGAGTLGVRTVSLGIAPTGTPEAGVAFDAPATLFGGTFSGTLAVPGPGDYEVWARACLAAACGSASTPLTEGG